MQHFASCETSLVPLTTSSGVYMPTSPRRRYRGLTSTGGRDIDALSWGLSGCGVDALCRGSRCVCCYAQFCQQVLLYVLITVQLAACAALIVWIEYMSGSLVNNVAPMYSWRS